VKQYGQMWVLLFLQAAHFFDLPSKFLWAFRNVFSLFSISSVSFGTPPGAPSFEEGHFLSHCLNPFAMHSGQSGCWIWSPQERQLLWIILSELYVCLATLNFLFM